MNYFYTTILVMLMTVGSVSAQHMNIGVKGGFNSYTVKTDDANFDSKLGFHIGVLGHFHLDDQLGLQPEIVFSMQGAKRGSNELSLDYVNIPVLFQYMFDNGFRLQAGPQLGILMNAEAENSGLTIDIKNETKPIEMGLALGASYVNPATGLGFDVRYNLGLSNINESNNIKSYNRGIQLGVFYLFGHTN
jgi:hypothetical protein